MQKIINNHMISFCQGWIILFHQIYKILAILEIFYIYFFNTSKFIINCMDERIPIFCFDIFVLECTFDIVQAVWIV